MIVRRQRTSLDVLCINEATPHKGSVGWLEGRQTSKQDCTKVGDEKEGRKEVQKEGRKEAMSYISINLYVYIYM